MNSRESEGTPSRLARLWDLVELTLVWLGSLLWFQLTMLRPLSFLGVVLAVLVVSAMIFGWLRRRKIKDPTPINWGWSVAWVGAPTLAVISILLLLGGLLDSARWALIPERLLWYPLWATVQQIWLLWFIWPRLRSLVSHNATAIALAGLLFALIHLPNPTMSSMTLIAGTFWVWAYSKGRNLWINGLSHGLLGLFVVTMLPFEWTWEFRFGEWLSWAWIWDSSIDIHSLPVDPPVQLP